MNNRFGGGNANPKNYKFIQLNIQPRYYKCDEADRINSGYIDVTLVTIGNVHIGNGRYETVGGQLVKSFEKVNGRYVVPGSSLKGFVRNTARIVSDSCVPTRNGDDRKLRDIVNIKCGAAKSCIVCDMFGTLGRRSRVYFDDLIGEESIKPKVISVHPAHSPHAENGYLDGHGKFKGYKLYPTECETFDGNPDLQIEVVPPDTEFHGKDIFRAVIR